MIRYTDLAYAAGYTDGDGCFSIGKVHSPNRIRYRALFIINSTEIENVQWFQRIFGGTISSAPRRKTNHKIIYRYTLKAEERDKFLNGTIRFFKEKFDEALIFLEFINARTAEEQDSIIDKMHYTKECCYLISIGNIDEFESGKNSIHPNITDFAYLAGFIDAECCLNIQKNFPKNRPNPTYKIQLQCNNSKFPTFKWIAERFGGQFYFIDRSKYRNNRNQIAWRLSSAALHPILKGVYHFLKHKQAICAKLLEFYDLTLNRSKSPSPNSSQFTDFYKPYLDAKESIFHQIQLLNKKGI